MLRRRIFGAGAALIGGLAMILVEPLSAAEQGPGVSSTLMAEIDRGLLEAHKNAYAQSVGSRLKAELQAELKQSLLRPRIELVSIDVGSRG